ncbi:MAG: sugar transferase [Patescibacteria group bacterium]
MKKSDLIFTAILPPVDYLMLVLAGLAAYFLRTSDLVVNWRPVLFGLNLPLEKYLGLVLLTDFFLLIIFALVGLYSLKRSRSFLEEFSKIIISSLAVLVGVIFYIFIRREWFDSRFLIFAVWVFSIIFVSFGRVLVKSLQKFLLLRFGFGSHQVIMIGGNGVGQELMDEVREHPAQGYQLAKYFSVIDLEEIKKIVQGQEINDVILANSDFPRGEILELIDFCEQEHLNFKFVPNLFQARTANVDFDTLGGVPLIELKRTALDGWGKILKRLIDIVGATFGILIFSPVMALVAILIKIDSPGSVIYKNQRVGPRGLFNTYKFRSFKIEYCIGPEYDRDGRASDFEDELIEKQSGRKGPVYKVINDPRRTKIGRFLEKSSLDELLQFFNVICNNMSLVGPRPHTPKEVAKYERWHKKVFNIKPGITGLAQISGRSRLDFDEEAKLDIYYLENWSFWLDLKILLKTPWVVLVGRGH